MRRPLLIALLAFGTVAGFTAGFVRLHHRHSDRCFPHHHRCGSQQAAPPPQASPPPAPP